MFLSENKLANFWKNKFGYRCYIRALNDVDNGRNVEWKYRNAVLGPNYIPFEARRVGLSFGKTNENSYRNIGRSVIRKWRRDIEGVSYGQILHCSGAALELHKKYQVTSEIGHGHILFVKVRGHIMVKNIKISVNYIQTKNILWNSTPNKISFSRRLAQSFTKSRECVISVSCSDIETWKFKIDGKIIVVNSAWNGFAELMKEDYAELYPDVMRFYHDLIFLLAEKPRLASVLTVYDDYIQPRVSMPKIGSWDCSLPRPYGDPVSPHFRRFWFSGDNRR